MKSKYDQAIDILYLVCYLILTISYIVAIMRLSVTLKPMCGFSEFEEAKKSVKI